MSVQDELRAIWDRRGALTPKIVVAAARPKNAPLHSYFEWNNTVAGEAYREIQAARLIRAVWKDYESPTDEEKRRVRAWVSLHKAGAEEPDSGYAPVEEVLADPVAKEVLLKACRRDLANLTRSYRHLEEYAALLEAELSNL